MTLNCKTCGTEWPNEAALQCPICVPEKKLRDLRGAVRFRIIEQKKLIESAVARLAELERLEVEMS